MRTTLTIDDDVAVQIERLRRSRRVSLKTLINDTLRKGLAAESGAGKQRPKTFRTKSFDLGPPLLPNLDNIADILAQASGWMAD
jgi:hypothetical protein